MLTDMLKNHPTFQDLNPDTQLVFARLAVTMQEDSRTIFLSPQQLEEVTQVGNRHQWASFLELEPVRHYIAHKIKQHTEIASRQALHALTQAALSAGTGQVSAIKEINELSEMYQKNDNNKVVILHQINRPKRKTPQEA